MTSLHQPSSYDRVPYESYPFPHLHPARLAATLQLRGLKPPPVATARVLDLGCGSGAHVIALAGFYPKMQLIGVDLAATQIAAGQQRIRDIGLRNVSLHVADLGQGLPASAKEALQAMGGQFDYILCQGVYYVVPDSVRSAIWRVIDQYLTPHGVAHISFNTYPGWKQREVAQDFVQFHTRGIKAEADIALEQEARSALATVASLAPKQTQGSAAGYGHGLQAEAVAAAEAEAVPGLLFHEFLSGDNRPLDFIQKAEQAKTAGFAFACEAALPDAWPEWVLPAGQALFDMAQGDPLRLEQYIDFATARTYRNSLWVREKVSVDLRSGARAWSVQALRGLHLAVNLRASLSGDASTHIFTSASGQEFSVAAPHEPMLRQFARAAGRPLWLSADTVLDSFPQSATVLVECVLFGLVQVWLEPPAYSGLQAMRMPTWLRADAARAGSVHIPNIWLQAEGLRSEDRQFILQIEAGVPPESLSPQGRAVWARFEASGWLGA